MVPEGWSRRKLAEILCRVVDPVEVDPTDIYQEIGIRSHGKGIFHKEPVQGEKLGNKRVFWVKSDCLIVNIVFAWEQAVARTTQEEVGKIASHRFPMYRPRDDTANVDFLTYYFKTSYGKRLLGLASPGGAGRNKTLGQKEFGNIGLLLPTGGEQQKIARVLSTWDKAIETVEKLIENSKAQKKALMQQLLTGKRRLPDFSHPWKEVHLGRICTYSKGYTYKSNEYSETPTEHNFLTLKSIEKGGGFNRNGVKYLTHEVDTKYQVSSGDIVFAITDLTRNALVVGSPLHVPSLPGQSITISMDLVKLRVNPSIDRNFLFYLLSIRSLRNFMRARSHGSTVLHLDVRGSKKARLFIPTNINEQRAISSILNSIDKQISTYEQTLKKHRVEKKALMQQLLTGKRRVKVDDS